MPDLKHQRAGSVEDWGQWTPKWEWIAKQSPDGWPSNYLIMGWPTMISFKGGGG